MQRTCPNQNGLEIQLTDKLSEHRPLEVPLCGIAALAYCHANGGGIKRNLGNVDVVGRRPIAEPPLAVGSIEPPNVLPLHTS